jgi:hypothetical protein
VSQYPERWALPTPEPLDELLAEYFDDQALAKRRGRSSPRPYAPPSPAARSVRAALGSASGVTVRDAAHPDLLL